MAGPAPVPPSPIWYEMPAKDWKSAIPIGNGRIGGMIFGDVRSDQVVLNENSIWAGSHLPKDNPRGPALLKKMRTLLFAGKYAEASDIARTEFLAEDPTELSRSYQPLAFLHIDSDLANEATEYRRWLDYESALAEVSFRQDGVEYRREAFVSAPDQALVVRLTSGVRGKLSFTVWLDRPAGATVEADKGNGLHLFGQANELSGRSPGVKFDALMKLDVEGGHVSADGNRLRVSNADRVTAFVTSATDYNPKNPANPLARDRHRPAAFGRAAVSD